MFEYRSQSLEIVELFAFEGVYVQITAGMLDRLLPIEKRTKCD